ncbi:GNAT family N-acetyltransferase [Candidatus Peregrinibacteria bacterium]|nr:GNAT family N-acetyltransferase [Candidatus Peregrinibacteria bacterium]
MPEKPTNLIEYIQRTDDNAKGENLPKDWMPSTTYWLIDNNEFVGHVNIRHKLVDWSKKRGGHIGFAIRKSARKKGYGNKIMKLALEKAREIGLKKVLLTCDDTNIASQRIIEKNKGELQDKIEVKDKLVRRYWITI